MKNNSGFTLVELLAVIVVLAIVTIIATQSILPLIGDARPDAFRVEATEVINITEDVVQLYFLGNFSLSNNNSSCIKDNEICITVEELINKGLYEDKSNAFSGKVLVDITDKAKPEYTLYLQKGAEFSIVGGTKKDYTNSEIVEGGFTSNVEEYTTCNCS